MERVCDLEPSAHSGTMLTCVFHMHAAHNLHTTVARQFSCLYLVHEQGVPVFLRGAATLKCDEQGSVVTVCRMEPDSDWQAEAHEGHDTFPGGVPDAGVLATKGITVHTLLR